LPGVVWPRLGARLTGSEQVESARNLRNWIDWGTLLDAWVSKHGWTVRLYALESPLESYGYVAVATRGSKTNELIRFIVRDGDELGSIKPGTEFSVLDRMSRSLKQGPPGKESIR